MFIDLASFISLETTPTVAYMEKYLFQETITSSPATSIFTIWIETVMRGKKKKKGNKEMRIVNITEFFD